jgi:pheromone shutdown protein TraB
MYDIIDNSYYFCFKVHLTTEGDKLDPIEFNVQNGVDTMHTTEPTSYLFDENSNEVQDQRLLLVPGKTEHLKMESDIISNTTAQTEEPTRKQNKEPTTVQQIDKPEFLPSFITTMQANEEIDKLLTKYKDKIVCCANPHFPHCEIYLCGTLHVSQASVDMVREAVRTIKPQFVAVELCETRLDTLIDYSDSVRGRGSVEGNKVSDSLWCVLLDGLRQRSAKVLGMGLLAWMQNKAAVSVGHTLGAELSVAAQEGHKVGAAVVLADRRYDVTSTRIFDRLSTLDRFKMLAVVMWEALTTSLFHVRDYVAQSEAQAGFVAEEMARFARGMPRLAEVVIAERDEYLAQTVCEIAKTGFGVQPPQAGAEVTYFQKGIILAVVGAGHMAGIRRHIAAGGVSQERAQALGTSSEHLVSTWPGEGRLRWVDTKTLFGEEDKVVVDTETTVKLIQAGAADIEECDY